ncbi:hypothetical protein SS05631_b59330 (plasmid) [Sinorhizobium sp. CCBAU 05631]|nr:hypothetical protein SS05631_b59330 [Sinorhizobium sp. CCBAU 05631]
MFPRLHSMGRDDGTDRQWAIALEEIRILLFLRRLVVAS